MSPLSWVYILLGILILAIVIITILFVCHAPPFNKPYKFLDPMTWKPVESNTSWLTPEFDYGPFARSEPATEVTNIYNNLIIALGGDCTCHNPVCGPGPCVETR